MKTENFNRLHALRMENDAAGYAMQEIAPRFNRLADRHENGTAPRAVSAFNLFQTPPAVAANMAAHLELAPGARVLEPSAGLGRLLDALAPYSPREVVAVEIAADCAAELYRQDRAGVTIKQRDFLNVEPSELGQFDAVIMNPPFHMRQDIKHIRHALTFLRPGGRLVGLCMRTTQREAELKPLCSCWIDLPRGTFGKEGTNIEVSLLKIQI